MILKSSEEIPKHESTSPASDHLTTKSVLISGEKTVL